VMRARGGRLRVLVSDDVGLQNKRQRRLALNILPLASRLLARRRQPRDRLAASVAATLAPTHPALGRLECAFRPAVPPGVITLGYHPGVPPWGTTLDGRCARHRSAWRRLPAPRRSSFPSQQAGAARTSAQEIQAYHPSASRVIATVLGVPCSGRLQRMAIRPILERTRNPLSNRAPP
jgi:hypothetical protein